MLKKGLGCSVLNRTGHVGFGAAQSRQVRVGFLFARLSLSYTYTLDDQNQLLFNVCYRVPTHSTVYWGLQEEPTQSYVEFEGLR